MRNSAIALIALFLMVVGLPAAAKIVQSGHFVVDLDELGQPDENGVYQRERGVNLIGNPGFETGSLPPWTTNAWTAISTDAHSGDYCAEGITNVWIAQDIDPTDVSLINYIQLWSKQPSGVAFHAIDLFYGPDDYDEFLVAPGVDWTLLDITSQLRDAGVLTNIHVWSYTAPDDPQITLIDDVEIDAEVVTASGESSWSVVKSMYP